MNRMTKTVCLGLVFSALSAGAVTNVLQTISPAEAPQGATVLVTFTLSATPPPPPTSVPITGMTIGGIPGTAFAHTNQSIIAGQFSIPGSEPVGSKDVAITFAGSFVASKTGGFTVTQADSIRANFSVAPSKGVAPLTVQFAEDSVGTVTNRLWNFGDGETANGANPTHTFTTPGTYDVMLSVWGPLGSNSLTKAACITVSEPPTNGAYLVVDSGQVVCYDDSNPITPPAPNGPFYGQDAQHQGNPVSYKDNLDGTITDLTTGLMWVKARGSKVSWETAVSNAETCRVGGYDDWRMPSIKELYSLIQFSGANGDGFTSTAGYIPFIDTNFFDFSYGSGSGSERVIDCQDWSATEYVSTTMQGDATVFGVNFADGRIKGYPKYDPASGGTIGRLMYARYVRGNPAYGVNKFVNNGDGTITDKATRFMWARDDSGMGLTWSNALAWVQARNAENYLGHNDWRLPNAKELQSIVDYSRSPDTSASAAIDPVFNSTSITNEGGAPDYPFYWASTTLLDGTATASGVYVCFGRALGYMNGAWLDVHGAGAQRSDFKNGNPADYPTGRGPQGDAVRIFNFARLVRDVPVTTSWRFAFVGDTHVPLTSIPSEIAAAVVQDDAKLLIVAGDIVDSGAGVSASVMESQLDAWEAALAPASSGGVEVYVIRGNHENDVTGGLATWNDFFSGIRAMPENGPEEEVNLTYSFTANNALFIGLDEYVQIHRVNQTWLDAQLADNTRPHIFVFGHEPAFKAFHTDGLDDYPSERDAFWSSLSQAGARVYLCGHDHFFNLARIDDGDGDTDNDVYQCIVGTGGTTNWPPQRYSYNGTNDQFTPVNLSNVTNSYGYLLVEISGPGDRDLNASLTWKQRTYDAATDSYIYVATSNVLTYAADDRYRDTVGDGIPDFWRRQYFGGTGVTTNSLSCAQCDADQDGVNNAQEYMADTNPTNAASLFRLEVVPQSDFAYRFQSSVQRAYTASTTSNLATGDWSDIPGQTRVQGDGTVMVFTNPAQSAQSRFFRVQVEMP